VGTELARPLYHAPLTVGANHLFTIVNDALDLLPASEVEHPGPAARAIAVGGLTTHCASATPALTARSPAATPQPC